MTSKAGHTAGPKAFRSNDGDRFTAAQLVALADKVNAHLSTLAPVASVPLAEWNDMFLDFQTAAQLLIGVANTDAFVEVVSVAHETGLTPRQLADAYTALRDGGRTAIEAWKAERAELVTAARLALSEAESWVHDQLDGTSSLDSALKKLEPVRAALAKATAGGAV